jgi:hypothetical protein
MSPCYFTPKPNQLSNQQRWSDETRIQRSIRAMVKHTI